MAQTRFGFVNGHYTATYNGVNIGTTKEGFHIRETLHTEPITVDESGAVPVDGIVMGASYAIEMRGFCEYEKVKLALTQFSATSTTTTPVPGVGLGLIAVGQLVSSIAGVLVLTPSGGTAGNKTYTAACAIVENDVDIPLSVGLRTGSVTFACYPDPSKSTNALAAAIVES